MKKTSILVSIYAHPETFPPTLNAVNELSNFFSKVILLHRNNLVGNWTYPENIERYVSGELISHKTQLESSNLKKILFFLRFLFDMIKLCFRNKPNIILVYDPFALFAYYLIRPYLRFDHKVWYHNHDVYEIKNQRRYSIGWLAIRAEAKSFGFIDIFTLPTNDRLVYFPIDNLKGDYFILPNYPSKVFYNTFYKKRLITDSNVKIIYQGSITKNRGIEEILTILDNKQLPFSLNLVLKGYCDSQYKDYLLNKSSQLGVSHKLSFIGTSPYSEVPAIASDCHIGVAIFRSDDVMNTTLGTASNKIYEYAALGLPVLLNDTEQYRKYLNKYPWAFFTDCSKKSLINCIESILKQYQTLSDIAHRDFEQELNFEYYFKPIKNHLFSILKYS